MAEESLARERGSSSRRRDGEDRYHDRDRESSRRYRDERDEGRKHSRGERSKHDSDRQRESDKDKQHHRHSHRSGHHRSSERREQRRERHHDEGRSERERRHRHDKESATDYIPTSESLKLTSHATIDEALGSTSIAAASSAPTTSLKRDDWMTGGGSGSNPADPSGLHTDEVGYFSSLGKARVKAPRPEKADPEKLRISSRELNTQLREGKTVDEYDAPANANAPPPFGAPGHQWRMMKLKRTIDAAEQEGRRLEEVALERYATLNDFEHAQAEQRFLDGNEGGKRKGGVEGRITPTLQSVARRSYLLASGGGVDAESRSGADTPGSSRPASRQAFKRPGESSNPATPTSSGKPPRSVGFETPSSKPGTPTAIPNVFTPVIERPKDGPRQGVVIDNGTSDPDRPTMTPDQLNKLQAKILKSELMGDTELDALRAEYDRESARAKAHQSLAGDRGSGFAASTTGGNQAGGTAGVLVQDGERELQVLPTLDARGRMYDIGALSSSQTDPPSAANKKKRKLKGRDEFEARDPQTGSIVRYSADDDKVSLGDLVRQEKFSAGTRSVKDPDAELATNIMTDRSYSANLEEQDDEAHRYAKKKMRSDALKRQFAINDFARTKSALDRCRYCWQEEGAQPPRVAVVSSGYRAYLAIPDLEAVTEREEDHVLIVPMQHHLSLLEADDDTWDEIKNFQKCLLQMASAEGRAVVFYETVLSLKAQAHCVMEAVILPTGAMDLLPGVFKESLRSVGGEFSTHNKVIEFSGTRPFRNALVPNLPYFAVSWDYRWTTGYGHIIENMDSSKTNQDTDAYDVDEMSAGTGATFDPNFARDVIRGILEDLDNETNSPGAYIRSFAKSRKRSDDEKRRIKLNFIRQWSAVDWTKMLAS